MASEGTPVTERIVDAVAAHADTGPLDLPRLYDAVEPDALEALLEGSTAVTVRFRYAGHTVGVDGVGAIRIDGRLATEASAARVPSE